jgi:hypothetical protein
MINEPDPPVIITPLTSPLAMKSQYWTEECVAEMYSSNFDRIIAMVAIAALKPCSNLFVFIVTDCCSLIVVLVHERQPNT